LMGRLAIDSRDINHYFLYFVKEVVGY